MAKQKLLVGSVVILGMLLVGGFILMNFLLNPNPDFKLVEKKRILLKDSLTVQGNDHGYIPVNVSAEGGYMASFTVSDGKIIKFSVFPTPVYISMWQEGTYDPTWKETDHLDYRIMVGGDPSQPIQYILMFVNEDSYGKEVHLRWFRVWEEINYPVVIGGIAIIAMGAGLGTAVKIKKLHAGYLMCLFFLGLAVMFPLLGIAYGYAYSVLSLANLIQSTILLGALPIGVFVYLWITHHKK